MTRIGVRELRQNASVYLGQVEAGESVEVTVRGKLVAKLVPAVEGLEHDPQLAELYEKGLLVPPRIKGRIGDLPLVDPDPSAPASQEILDELREERL